MLYVQLRGRWEWGHVAAFAAWFCGVSLLLISVLVEMPDLISHKPNSNLISR
jgi:hypothetical protein